MDTIVVMKSEDNVATCLKDMAAGHVAEATVGGATRSVTLKNDIPFGHKIALCDIAKGDEVLKYAEIIGIASAAIAAGEHVHVHNVESIRARGDKVPGDGTKGGGA
ncbi:MAG: UxaA family hydrolase [Hyphomicrobiaceae bacterium]